ncbi:MAG TPA: hypothetical protein VFT37_03870 [Telluria sp.]|nr:hypothetical protein [Telluria sp.]
MSQQINLFNPVFLKQRKIFTSLAMAHALGVLGLGLATLAWYSQYSVSQLQEQADQAARQLERRQARLKAVEVELAPKPLDAGLAAQVAARELQLNALRQADDVLERGAFGNTRGYSDYFRAFARQDAPGLWLTGLTIDGAGQEISIDGRASEAELVPGYISKLSGEAVLKGKSFGSLQITTPSGGEAAAATAGAETRPAVRYVEFSLNAQNGSGG